MKEILKRQTGTPRSFDREEALETAMRLFWRNGYEGVSFQQLIAALDVTAPSLYAAFGNKEALYRRALDRYEKLRRTDDLSFMDEKLPLDQVVGDMLQGAAHVLLDPGGEVGCMLNTGMVASHPDHADVARDVADRRTKFKRLLSAKLRAWVAEEKAEPLARYIIAVIQGMAIQAKDGATVAELEGLVSPAVIGIAAYSD